MLYRKEIISICYLATLVSFGCSSFEATTALASLVSFGCCTVETTQVYEGEKQAPDKVAILSLIQHDVETRISTIDGKPLQKKGRFELLPGEKLVEASCIKHQPRDTFGTWRGREFLKFKPQAGHEYKLRAKAIGPGRCCSEQNFCTMWIEDVMTGETISEIIAKYAT